MKKGQLIRSNRINHEITASQVRLINIDGKPIGIISLQDSILRAKKYGVDLVEISPKAVPPVCRIMNYGKFLYEKSKAIKKQKKKQKILQIKEIKFRPCTEVGDYKVKLRNLIKFLEFGSKVKITLRFRGREMAHQRLGIDMLNRIKNDVKFLASIELFPKKIESRQMIMTLVPKKNINH